MKMILLAVTILVSTGSVHAEDVFRVSVGKDYDNYSNSDMKRRLWQLERAVDQLQRRIYQLESDNRPISVSVNNSNNDSWVCTVTAMGDRFTGTGGSKAVAMAKSLESCKAGRGGDGFFCKDPECVQ